MIPASFDYLRPSTIHELLGVLTDPSAEATLLAGGHGLLPAMKLRALRPRLLVDLARIHDLRGIDIDEARNVIRIGAMTTSGDIERSPLLRSVIPFLPRAARQISDPLIRNRATLGGSLVQADPQGDWPAVVVAADATLHLRDAHGERRVTATEFFAPASFPRIRRDEVLTAVTFPVPAAGEHGVYLKRTHPASGYAMLGVAIAGSPETGFRVGVAGATVRHSPALDDQLSELGLEAAQAAAQEVAETFDFVDNFNASATFRRELFPIYAKRAARAWASGVLASA